MTLETHIEKSCASLLVFAIPLIETGSIQKGIANTVIAYCEIGPANRGALNLAISALIASANPQTPLRLNHPQLGGRTFLDVGMFDAYTSG